MTPEQQDAMDAREQDREDAERSAAGKLRKQALAERISLESPGCKMLANTLPTWLRERRLTDGSLVYQLDIGEHEIHCVDLAHALDLEDKIERAIRTATGA